MDLAHAEAADFAPHRGSVFRLCRGADAFDTVLAEVTEHDVTQVPVRGNPFTLLFRGGPNPPLPQGLCTLSHDVLGALEVFLVPLAPDAQGPRYEAVFS